MKDRTIAAIATPVGMGGIAVIRVSGNDAFEICNKVFYGKTDLKNAQSHTVHYGYIIDKNGERVDEVLLTVMRAPKTYTREDVVEVSTHGGLVASRNVLKCILEAGAYPAEPGEFTKRAFLNGRIDLSQAEAVIDIINSKTTTAQKNALSQAGGTLSEEINQIRQLLVDLSASMQVLIDYPDEELEDVTIDDILSAVSIAEKRVKRLISSADNGKIMRDGIKTVIVGKPNVGKSSLLNLLAKEDRAIVTDIAGTTRDIIEESVNVDGVPLVLTDTAGIRATDDVVEKIGVEKSIKSIDEAQLVIVMLDLSAMPDESDKELLDKTRDKKRIIVVNKSDIKNDEVKEAVKKLAGDDIIEMSAKTGEGARELSQKIKELYNIGELYKSDGAIVTNMRHISALSKAEEALLNAQNSIECGMPSDIVSIDIITAIDALGEITGAVVSEDIVNAIFHDFCVGK